MSGERPAAPGLLPGEAAADAEALATRLGISPGAVRVRAHRQGWRRKVGRTHRGRTVLYAVADAINSMQK
ncbi:MULTISPECIES: hypothetical protein [unclassified Crossiella]|uniref:hypothetical protein n=1 Tax=unclassified Crossiella TaxID=2620835 RepID=UPI001FFEA028|nr:MULTISPECIES: hypothetical protein [unclassified Crossiella]MCK2242332.1 hypothetical protein [Crossiella sp. S99.2]MCK2254637.1 hypothetical protein [Crossiella sp. S99.1]